MGLCKWVKKFEKEPDRLSVALPDNLEVKYTEPEFIRLTGVRFKEHGHYRTPSKKFEGLIPHYTVSPRKAKNAIGVVKYLARKGLGCMVMDEDGKIYIPADFDPLKDVAWHAGTSKWGKRTGVSRYFAGMEICCWGRNSKVGPYRTSKGEENIVYGKYQKFTEAQEAALINFCLWALAINPEFKIANIVGHDEVRLAAGKKGSKFDPGASLSMTMPAFRDLITKLNK